MGHTLFIVPQLLDFSGSTLFHIVYNVPYSDTVALCIDAMIVSEKRCSGRPSIEVTRHVDVNPSTGEITTPPEVIKLSNL